ncbi:MAG: hypothetical protein EA403_07090 [Spirochaetaceae bacterium]|nr:MAG: hypothetical protein EA403_07090 [Spirochaetaceae bacterium]
MTLSRTGAGEATITVEMHRVLMEYLADLSGFAGGADMPVFDLAALEARFAAEPGLELLSARTPVPNRLELRFRYADIARVFDAQDAAVRDVFRFSQRGEERTLHLRLTPQSVRALIAFSPAADSMVADILLPPPEQPVTEPDYVAFLSWAFEEYERETPVADIIRGAMIELIIRPDGRVVSQQGGRINGDTVHFSIPIVRLLTLSDRLEYSLTFR